MRFSLLGPMEIQDGDRPVDPGGAKQRALLAVLLLNANTVVSTDAIVDALWGEDPPETAANVVQVYVSHLRKALEPSRARTQAPQRLITRAPGYLLAVENDEVDLLRFRRLGEDGALALARGDAANAARLLEEALSLWRGQALAEFADEPFARAAAEGLEERRIGVLEDRFDAMLALGRHGEMLEEIQAAAARHPLRERLNGQVILALYRAGRQADALAVYHQARETLAEELGIDPGPELQDLYAAILNQDASLEAPAPPPPSNLPAPLTSFIGRQDDLRQVPKRLAEGARLLTLTGPGGAGKTRLALEAARELSQSYPGGVWFVDLAPIVDGELVASAIASVLHVQGAAGVTLVRSIAAAITSPTLLVLDNCEHLVEACASAAAALLAEAADAQVLATSRERLGVTGEQVWTVQPLALPAADASPEALATSDAARLFLDRASAVAPHAGFSAEDTPAVARICAGLDGLPLGIELAAARCDTMTAQEIADALEDRFSLLRSGSRDALPRQRTLRALVDWSYELLDDEERRLFAACSVLAGPTDLEAIAEVCGLEAAAARDLVARLAAKSLVVAERDGDAMRFRMLETLRLYAAEMLEAGGAADALRRAHASWFTDLAEEARATGGVGSLEAIERNLDNLRAAMDWSAANDSALELRLANGMTGFWAARGHLAEGRLRVLRAVERADPEPSPQLALALLSLGSFTYALGEYGEARAAYERCMEVGRAIGMDRAVAVALNAFGGLASHAGDLQEARRYFGEARDLFASIEDPRSGALVLNNLGVVVSRLGDQQAARAHLDESVAILAKVGDDATRSIPLASRGDLLRAMGETEAARRDIDEALAIARSIGNTMIEAASLMTLGVLVATQDPAGARDALDRGIALAREIGAKEVLGYGLADAATLDLGERETARARERLAEALALHGSRGDRYGIACTLLVLARAEAADDATRRAAIALGATDALLDAIGATLRPIDAPVREELRARLRASLGNEGFDEAAAEGAGLSDDALVGLTTHRQG